MAVCTNLEKVYVCGGIHHEDTYLKKCESYDIKKDKWDTIKSMNLKRKNASSIWMNNEFVYVFGGSIPEENEMETVERYVISKNIWEILPIRLNNFMTSQILLRVSSKIFQFQHTYKYLIGRTLLMVGGNIIDPEGFKKRSDKVYRLFIDTNWIQEEVPLCKPVCSIYPGFVDTTNLMIIDEDHKFEQPTVVVYSIAIFLPGVSAEQEI